MENEQLELTEELEVIPEPELKDEQPLLEEATEVEAASAEEESPEVPTSEEEPAEEPEQPETPVEAAEPAVSVPVVKTKERKGGARTVLTILRIIAAIGLCASVPVLSLPMPLSFALMLAGGLVAGVDLLFNGITGFFREDYFNRNTLLLVIFVIAYIVGVGYEGSILLILTQIGLLLSDLVRKKAREHVLSLTGLQFESAHVLRGDQLLDCYLDEISAGDEIMVHAGEYFPVDCIIIDGNSVVDAQLIDGKSGAMDVTVGDSILAGMVNLGSDLHCEVVSDGSSTADDILEVLRHEGDIELPVLTKFFTPLMLLFSVALGVAITMEGNVSAYEAVHRALAVVTLSSAVPAFAGIRDIRFAARAGAASRGIVFATDDIFRQAGECESAVYCAEGTLTVGRPHVSEIHSEKLDEELFLKVAAHAMAYSQTEIGEAIVAEYGDEIALELIQDFREIPNCGVKAVFNGLRVVLGTQTLMVNWPGFEPVEANIDQQIYYMVVGNQYAGYMVLTDPIREYAENIPAALQAMGVQNQEFVTCYSEATAEAIAEKSCIGKYAFDRGADARLYYVEQVREGLEGSMMYLYHQRYASDEHSAADLDIAIGGMPHDLLSGRADIVIPGGRVSAVCDGIAAAQQAVRLSNLSVGAIFLVKLLLIVFAVAGFIPVWFAATLELLATLFIKVFSTGAFHENPFEIFKKQKKSQ